MKEETLLDKITSFYLNSGDFNGIPLTSLYELGSKDEINRHLQNLILSLKVSVVYGDYHPNPHIRALVEHHSPHEQIQLLGQDIALGACAYPMPIHLRGVINIKEHTSQPYKLELLLGEPQLSHRAFDLSILEVYRNDPRYHYETDDINGSISVRDKHYKDVSMKDDDKVFLQAFGFAYDDELNKYVAVFLWDLFKLSPEHQRLWKQKEVSVKTTLHPDYFKSSILGQWPEHVSIYTAFIEELQVLNKMSRTMGRPDLFRECYIDQDLPKGFSSLLRPTAFEYNDFVMLLDKLISENLDKEFFCGEISGKAETIHTDGKVTLTSKGTIQMLSEWIRLHFRPTDQAQIDTMFGIFSEIRKLRQKPAHNIYEDDFDQKYIHLQRELIVRAYTAIRTLRLIFANHPMAKKVEISEWLYKGKIWSR